MNQIPSPNDAQEGCCFIMFLTFGLIVIIFALAAFFVLTGQGL